MAATNTTTPSLPVDSATATSGDELAVKSVQKRYEGLVMVRTKAIKGKGAWYWTHLEPILVHNSDNGLPMAVKLRCSLCDSIFSASNPSRTASEHLKRGTCPNFNSVPKPISSVSPSSITVHHSHRKRSSSATAAVGGGGGDVSGSSYPIPPLAIVDPSRFCTETTHSPSVSVRAAKDSQSRLTLSGGKEDLGALAMLEDSVKKLRSPKTSPGPALSKNQINCAINFLADWAYESCGSVSFSSLEHPKFKAFLNQVGLPEISSREFLRDRLASKFEVVKADSEAKIRDAMFFQLSSNGWKGKSFADSGEEKLVNLTVNLPNGTSLYQRAVFVGSSVPSKYAEDVLLEAIASTSGNVVHRCVGIVADKFKEMALRNLENQNQWMVNLSCQFQGILSLIKDFTKELPFFKTVTENCRKLVHFINFESLVRHCFNRCQIQEYGHARFLRSLRESDHMKIDAVYTMLEDTLSSSRALQLVFLDEDCKVTTMEDPLAKEVAEFIGDVRFWNEVEAVHSLIKLIKDMSRTIEAERPLVGQCLPLWDELKAKVKDWCSKFHVAEEAAEKAIERRFKKNYHPAWAAAFILDPQYLIRDTSGKYLPPFKCLTTDQEKDVDKLITRLVSREEAHIALMELMKWRTEGLNPVYARAVQLKERDPITGKLKISNPQSGRLVWETYLTEFKTLGKVAVRLIFLHSTCIGFKCNKSILRWVRSHGHPGTSFDKVQKLIFIAAHSKLERRDFSTEEDKDADLLAMENGEDDVLSDAHFDTSSL